MLVSGKVSKEKRDFDVRCSLAECQTDRRRVKLEVILEQHDSKSPMDTTQKFNNVDGKFGKGDEKVTPFTK